VHRQAEANWPWTSWTRFWYILLFNCNTCALTLLALKKLIKNCHKLKCTFYKHPEECGQVKVAQEYQGYTPPELNLKYRIAFIRQMPCKRTSQCQCITRWLILKKNYSTHPNYDCKLAAVDSNAKQSMLYEKEKKWEDFIWRQITASTRCNRIYCTVLYYNIASVPLELVDSASHSIK
jgi:hypothetical protein